MAQTWYRGFHALCNWLYFDRIEVLHPERLPKSGPVLYLGLHRNGAVDGFVYHTVLPEATFLIAKQLRRNPLGRLFFHGIEVVRANDDGDRTTNQEALQHCVKHLKTGGQLFVFPEGTSSLGPKHLPFKSGAARLLNEYLTTCGSNIHVVPLGIHYECAWAFRSKVEIVVGEPIHISLPDSIKPLARIKELKRRIEASLETVGINVETEAQQEEIQRLAYLSTLGTRQSYFETLKRLEKLVCPEMDPAKQQPGLLCHHGVPLFPRGSVWVSLVELIALAPIVSIALALNFLPFAAAGFAGWKYSDARNVISLWRILVGVPLFILWVAGIAIGASTTGHLWWFGMYAVATVLGLKCYSRVKRLTVAVYNGLLHPKLRANLFNVWRSLPKETPA